jgi:hypothetical protein
MSKREKAHYTFDNNELDRIGRDNIHLLNRLAHVATRKNDKVGSGTGIRSSFEINRMKAAQEIEAQNFRLLKRLQTTKSSLKVPGGGSSSAAAGFTVTRPRAPSDHGERRPAWDSTLGGSALANAEPAQRDSTRRPQFKSRDLRDVALEACPDAHTLRK